LPSYKYTEDIEQSSEVTIKMISKKIIRKVVIEVLARDSVKQRNEFNLMHRGDDGTFSDGSDDGSCSDGGTQKTRKKDKCGASSAKCGRKGDKWCRNNKKRSRAGMIKEEDIESDTILYLRELIKTEIEETIEKVLVRYKNERTSCNREDILKYLNQYELASKGRLYSKKKS